MATPARYNVFVIQCYLTLTLALAFTFTLAFPLTFIFTFTLTLIFIFIFTFALTLTLTFILILTLTLTFTLTLIPSLIFEANSCHVVAVAARTRTQSRKPNLGPQRAPNPTPIPRHSKPPVALPGSQLHQ
eukprot:g29625.t1